ncbi:hypothetical protein D3C79_1011310 [compost metagenome]
MGMAEVQACVVTNTVAVVEGMVEAERGFAAVVGAVLDAAFTEVLVAAGELGDVVDRAAYSTSAKQKA